MSRNCVVSGSSRSKLQDDSFFAMNTSLEEGTRKERIRRTSWLSGLWYGYKVEARLNRKAISGGGSAVKTGGSEATVSE